MTTIQAQATLTATASANPGCDAGPQGFHIYDTAQEGEKYIECVYCGDEKTELQILAELTTYEPPEGSIVLQDGTQGTAWQRFYNRGTWNSATGRQRNWDDVLGKSREQSRVWLVYVPHRPRG